LDAIPAIRGDNILSNFVIQSVPRDKIFFQIGTSVKLCFTTVAILDFDQQQQQDCKFRKNQYRVWVQ